MELHWPRATLGSRYSLAEKARRLSNFRFVELELLELLAGWSQSIVYIPLRVGFGTQMYTQALHCRNLAWALGNLKRAHFQTVAPTDEFVRLCERIWRLDDPLDRLVAVYWVLKPHIVRAYEAHIGATDTLADAHSIHVLRTAVANHRADITWGGAMIAQLAVTPARRTAAADLRAELERALTAAGGVVAEGAVAHWVPAATGDAELEAVRASLPGVGELRSRGYTYRKRPAPCATGRQPLPNDLCYRQDIPGYEPPEFREGSPEWLLFWVHHLWYGENFTVDRMGRMIVDFPDAPFALRFDMAQQAWEEARHIEIDAQIVEILGGRIGMYPLRGLPYDEMMSEPDPCVRLVRDNIVGEGNAAARSQLWLKLCSHWLPTPVLQGIEHLAGDERVHIGFGNDWTERLTNGDSARRAAIVQSVETQIVDWFTPQQYEEWCGKIRRRYGVRR
jgi:hypothetical protein